MRSEPISRSKSQGHTARSKVLGYKGESIIPLYIIQWQNQGMFISVCRGVKSFWAHKSRRS